MASLQTNGHAAAGLHVITVNVPEFFLRNRGIPRRPTSVPIIYTLSDI
jgi:hypothetical protein